MSHLQFEGKDGTELYLQHLNAAQLFEEELAKYSATFLKQEHIHACQRATVKLELKGRQHQYHTVLGFFMMAANQENKIQ